MWDRLSARRRQSKGHLIHERRKPMMKIIALQRSQPYHGYRPTLRQFVGSIPEEFRGDWCQESTKDNIFKPAG
jgi:hypothetical protein